MQINRQTYEEFFLLYADGELSDMQKKEVEEFVTGNPDLAEEFSLVQSTIMQPDETIVFADKHILFKEEKEDRKIFYMPWFRMAAAAAVLLALTVGGWLFINDKDANTPPVAVVEKPVNTAVTKNNPAPAETTAPQTVLSQPIPAEQNASVIEERKSKPKKVRRAEIKPAQADEENLASNSEKPGEQTGTLEKALEVPEVVRDETALSAIDMAVTPREMDAEEAQQPVAQYAHANYDAEPQKNDMIYFANTSLTKKTKLRGVFRKASRYLDRVTSLQ